VEEGEDNTSSAGALHNRDAAPAGAGVGETQDDVVVVAAADVETAVVSDAVVPVAVAVLVASKFGAEAVADEEHNKQDDGTQVVVEVVHTWEGDAAHKLLREEEAAAVVMADESSSRSSSVVGTVDLFDPA
jgi:hypothetical protein